MSMISELVLLPWYMFNVIIEKYLNLKIIVIRFMKIMFPALFVLQYIIFNKSDGRFIY